MLMLLFYAGSNCLAIDTAPVIEVFPTVKLKKIAGQAENLHSSFSGLLNYGGHPIPVIDVCQLIEKRACEEAMHTRLILLQLGPGVRVALMAEKVLETLELDKKLFLEFGIRLPELAFLRGIYQDRGRQVQFFDTAAFHVAFQDILV